MALDLGARRGRSHARLPLALVALAFAGAVAGPVAPPQLHAQQPFTPEDALEVKNLSVADVTEDGRWIVATIATRADRLSVDHLRFGDPTYVSPSVAEVVVIDAETGERTPLFDEKVQLRGLAWSPDGTRLAYLLREGDPWDGSRPAAFTLRVWDRTTGEHATVDLDTGKALSTSSSLAWRPDGSGLLVELRPEGWAGEARAAYEEMSAGPVIVQDAEDPFLDWERVRNLDDIVIPALVTLPGGEVRELAAAGYVADVEQSEDGRFVSLLTVEPLKTVYAGSDGSEWGLLRLDLETGDTLRLVEPSTDRISTAWSPDGTRWAWADDGDVHLRTIEGDSAVNLTERFREAGDEEGGEDTGDAPASGSASDEDEEDEELRFAFERWRPDGAALLLSSDGPDGEAWHVLELESGELRQVFAPEGEADERPRRSVEGWSPDGRWLYLSTSERDRWERGLARLDVSEGASGELETLVSDRNLYRGWRLAEDGSRLIFEMSDGDRPDDLYVADPAFRSTTRLTDLNPWLEERALARTELVEYLDADGETRYGILYLPADHEEDDEPRPLVVEVYEDFFDNGFHTTMNVMTGEGWVGFRPSVEFEEGYPGEAWLKGVTAGVNELIERGLVDGDKVGIHGTSYGGYATNLLITQTDRFAAAINISGKVNIISFLGDSPKITTRNYRAAERGQDRIGATLWEQPQKYVAHSAVMFADRIDTPLLLLSGEGDWNVPHTNQREMYYALRRLGKDVVWVHYMTGGHGAGWASTPGDYVDQYERMVAWYAEHFAEADEEGAGEAGIAGGGR